jgi:CubicO group peptidase (beta-lactamase class C family)
MKIAATTISSLALVAAAHGASVQLTDCSLLGPVYPMPANLTASRAIQKAQSTFSQQLSQLMRNGSSIWGPVNSVNTSISLAVFSPQSQDLLAEFHHIGTGPGVKAHLTSGVLNADTIYRTGSVGKLLSVYTFMVKLGTKYWNEPVSKYIPELADLAVPNAVQNFNWTEVTIGSLAGQMSGLPRDCETSYPDLCLGGDAVD